MNDSEPDDATAHRRVRVGVVVAAAVALLVAYGLSADDDERVDSIDDVVAAGLSPPPRAVATTAQPTSRSLAKPASSPVAAADARDEVRPGTVEVCGVGRVPADRSDALDDAQAARARSAIAKVISSLRSDADERARVSGLYLQGVTDVAAAATAHRRATSERCGADAACIEDAGASGAVAMARAVQRSAEEIAQMASASRDPFTYAVALQACGRIGVTPVEAPSCRLLSVEQWARIDPNNAAPWLHVATAARARKDGAALDEAMYRVAAATSNRIYGDALFGITMAHVPADAEDLEQAQLFFAAVEAPAGWQLPAYQTVIDYCASTAIRDSNRWQTCDAVAHRLVEQPSTILDRRIGRRLGERVGWPADRIATLRDEDDAMWRAANRELVDPEPTSCRAVDRMRGFWLLAARLGEPGAARAMLAASGQSVAALAAEARADRARAEAVAASAVAVQAVARAASAASGS